MSEVDPLSANKQSMSEAASEGFIGLRDSPTTDDHLGFDKFANSIAERILRDFAGDFDKSTQITIGIYGEWGSGKTSFLQMVAKYLNEKSLSDEDRNRLKKGNLSEKDKKKLTEKGICPIWFDAWKYDKEDNLWAALIQKILDEITVKGRWYRRARVKFIIWKDSIKLREGLWEVLKKVTPVLLRLLLIIIGLYIFINSDAIAAFLPSNSVITSSVQANIVKVIGVFAAAVSAVSGPFNLINLFKGKLGIDFSKFRHQPSYRGHIAFLDEFSKEFEKIIRLLGQKKPLVVIIDDLDRCLPEKAIQVIEAIKIFLDFKGCIFLLGLDRDIVKKAVAVKYKEMNSISSENKTISFRRNTVFYEDYIDKFIQFDILLPRLSRLDDIEKFVTEISSDEDIKKCASIFGAGLSPNPRRIKRVLRTFLFVRDMIVEDIKSGQIKTSILAKLIVIQSQMPDIFDVIIERSSLLEELETFYLTQDGGQIQLESIPESAPPARQTTAIQQAKVNSTDKMNNKDKLLHELAEKYTTDHPELRRILLTKDTFMNIDMNHYIDLMGVLAVVRQLPEPRTDGNCHKCHQPLQLGAEFCAYCGERVTERL